MGTSSLSTKIDGTNFSYDNYSWLISILLKVVNSSDSQLKREIIVAFKAS
jgi:hypothetical protein